MRLRIIFLVVLLNFCAINLFAQSSGYFQLRGRIYNAKKQSLPSVSFRVYEGIKVVDESKTSQQGVFSIKFQLNKTYVVEIKKENYTTKRILVDTKVPEDKESTFFDLFSLIFLENPEKADPRSKNGLPISKYYYKKSISDFTADRISNRNPNNKSDKELIKRLKAELNRYKLLVDKYKQMITEAERVASEANLIKADADAYADSIVDAINEKARLLLEITQLDTTQNKEIGIRELTNDEYSDLGIDKEDFENKKNIKELENRINELNSRRNKTRRDSLNIKRDRLSVRKELFDLAKYQLEIDKLNAKTKEDREKIAEREAQLFLMEQEITFAEQELENANTQLALKELEIRNKNIMIYSFIAGSVLLLVLLSIIYFNFRNKKKINKILEYQNQELEKLSIVASETSNAIVITDRTGKYTWVNHGYTRLFGYDVEDVTGSYPRSLFNEDNGEEVNDLIKKAMTEGQAVDYELETESRFGQKIWIQTTLTPIIDGTGKVDKLIVIDSDISKIKEAELEILKQSRLLELQNTQIVDSINYAKRIQDAILPSTGIIKSFFKDAFIYFKPRDIVSGDFYWFSVQNEMVFLAAVDCTGHGVPGAFMSLIGNSLLTHIVNERKIYSPADILKELNKGVIMALSQSAENEEREDGMDLTICRFDKNKKEVQIACANHTALLVNGDDIREIDGDEISIGDIFARDESVTFTNHTHNYSKNSMLYLFSDGYQDQLGGPKNKKFMAGKFTNFLIENQKEGVNIQFEQLDTAFKEWKGSNRQTDDVLVMGIRLQ